MRTTRLFSLLLVFATFSLGAFGSAVELEISKLRDFRKAQHFLDTSTADSVLIKIRAGEYRLRDSFHIDRSNVTVQGEAGVRLVLADNVLAPVIAIGTQSEYAEEFERIENVSVLDLEIDGNMAKQKSEYNRERPWIRNNGIDVRTVTGLRVERVRCNNNRSGGLVISWRCRDVVVRDSVFEGNFFDGVAYYDSERVYTVDCAMRRNLGAGISIDNSVTDALFSNCSIEANRDVGVFARHSSRLMFYKSRIVGSGNWAFFLSHDEKDLGVFDSEIASCMVEGNNGGVRMGSVNERQSSGNRVVLTEFVSNDGEGRPDLSTAGSRIERLEAGWNPELEGEAADLKGKSHLRPYSERLYQALNEFDALLVEPES